MDSYQQSLLSDKLRMLQNQILLYQFAFQCTKSRCSNRIYTIILIRRKQGISSAKPLEIPCLWLIKIDNRIEVRAPALCALGCKLNTAYNFATFNIDNY